MTTPTDNPTMETSGDDLIKEAGRVVSDIFTVTRGLGGVVENAKVNVGRLYMRQIFAGGDANQSDVIEPNAATGLGKTGVNNWAIYDGPGSRANLVAHGQGMHTYAGNWNQWLTLVFKDERYKQSTLQVMGASAEDEENEWAIVGGTGEFAMARGTVKRRVYSILGGTLTQELIIEFFCRMTGPTKRGPWGGNGGSLHEMEGKSQRLESVRINHGGVVHAIGFSYTHDGQVRTAGIWGELKNGSPDKTETFIFGPSEVVKKINGTGTSGTGASGSPVYLSKFEIVTNLRTLGPFGTVDGAAPFSYTVPEGETVVGFFANIDGLVRKIGVYTI